VPEPSRFLGGLRLAVATLTVAPVRVDQIDRAAAAVAMSLAPAVGLALGVIAAAVGVGLYALGAPLLLAAVGTVATPAVLTRGLHLDGLADTADGLGSYADRETALAIMRKPDIGPFGVVTLVLVLLTQVAAATAVLARPWPSAAAGVVAAVAAGRVAIAVACRRGVPPARPDGLGALVAGTVPMMACVLAGLVVAAVAVPAVPGHPWQGPLAVALAVLAVLALVRHATSRLGGITGDVLGAVTEVAVTVTYCVLSI
jgi:adenosylcobinamide-GDP ribazoletransferase